MPPLEVDHLVACVDGTPASERGLPVAAAWAHALGMKLTIVTVAEPSPPPVRIGAPWRRHHGPNEDADEYIRRLGEQWALDAPGLETFVVYDPISAAAGLRDFLATHPAGLIAVTSHLRGRFPHVVLGSGAADIVDTSTAPALVVPAQESRGRAPASPLHHPVVIEHAARRAADGQLRIADAITGFAGSMPFVYLHAVAFACWMLLVESDPWPRLTLIVSLEAIFLSTFVMIGQNRQAEFQRAKADHDFATETQELRRTPSSPVRSTR